MRLKFCCAPSTDEHRQRCREWSNDNQPYQNVELVKALKPFPEARLAVAQVLYQLKSKAAESIKAKELPS
jgi:hypothetical protein